MDFSSCTGMLQNRVLLLLTILSLPTACSYFHLEPEPSQSQTEPAAEQGTKVVPPETSNVRVEKLDMGEKQAPTNDIEIIWTANDESALGFIIKYGFSKEHQDKEVKVLTSQLEQRSDPMYGVVFRYLIEGVPKDQEIFVSLSAFNERGISLPTEVISIPPER